MWIRAPLQSLCAAVRGSTYLGAVSAAARQRIERSPRLLLLLRAAAAAAAAAAAGARAREHTLDIDQA